MNFLNKAFPGPTLNGSATTGTILDGISSLGWEPRTIFISVQRAGLNVDVGPNTATPMINPGGFFGVFQILGLLGQGGVYQRRFQLPIYRTIAQDVAGFSDLRVNLIASNLPPGCLPFVNVTNRPINTRMSEPVTITETYLAGQFLVPPGADRAYPAGADPGFSWSEFGNGGPTSIPDPLVVGTEYTVKGPMFTTSVPITITWRLYL